MVDTNTLIRLAQEMDDALSGVDSDATVPPDILSQIKSNTDEMLQMLDE